MANRIVINNDVITGLNILSGKAYYEHSMVGESLAVDTMNFTVCLPQWDTSKYKYGDPVKFYNNYDNENDTGKIYAKQYLSKITQTSRNTWRVDTVSIMGILMSSQHYGGMYNGALASTVLADILKGVSYTVEPTIANATLTGYLPVQSKRDNLQQVLFAIGGGVQIDNEGNVLIEPLSAVSAGTFDKSRVFEGGRVEVNDIVDGCTLTEHNYFESQEQVTLYDDGIASDTGERIIFDEPYHSLSLTKTGTVSIVEQGTNYIIFKGTGHATLTGKKYTHVTRVVSAGQDTGNIKTVQSAYLANPQIAQDLVERVYNYLTHNVTIKQSVLFGTERPGDTVQVINPYTDEIVDCCIKSMNLTMSKINKADAEFIVGFVPEGVVSGFTNYKLATASGSWTIPTDVNKIRIILVGGGTGGTGGYKGETAKGGEAVYGDQWETVRIDGTTGGAGGKAGSPGSGGLIYELTLDVNPGETINYTIGSGGSGGATEGGEGKQGSNTTLTVNGATYGSNLGRQFPYGYYEAKSGLTFANAGAAGYDGASGGAGGNAGSSGTKGNSVLSWAGGAGGSGATWYDEDYIAAPGNGRGGGGGGGAAYGKAGNKGGTAYETDSWTGQGAGGGSGATPPAPAAPTNYGQGGNAGHGGGGGGGAGGGWGQSPYFGGGAAIQGAGGVGGAGSAGGAGKAGCVVIYY